MRTELITTWPGRCARGTLFARSCGSEQDCFRAHSSCSDGVATRRYILCCMSKSGCVGSRSSSNMLYPFAQSSSRRRIGVCSDKSKKDKPCVTVCSVAGDSCALSLAKATLPVTLSVRTPNKQCVVVVVQFLPLE